MASESGDAGFVREIDAMLTRLERDNHYTLLGVAPDAVRAAIHAAYEVLRERFDPEGPSAAAHPEQAAELLAVATALREAHAVLSTPARRREYDALLRSDPSGMSHQTRDAGDGACEGEVAEQARRKRALKRLTGRLQSVGTQAKRPARAGATDASRNAQGADGAVAALRRSLADSSARGERPRPAVPDASPHAPLPRSAAAATPDTADRDTESPELRARRAEQEGRWGSAARAWARASDARPDVEALARRAALNFLKDGSQLSRGVDYAKRAVELAPEDAFTHRILGQLFLEARLWQNARAALQQSLALNPDDAAVHALLERARRHG